VEQQIIQTIKDCKAELKPTKWTEEDIALGCFIETVGIIARFSQINDQNEALSLKESINRCLRAVEQTFPALAMKKRGNGKSVPQ
jgi:hypothetical protein